MKKWQKIDKKSSQKEHPAPQKLKFCKKKKFFFYSKRPPNPAKNSNFAWKNDKKLTKKLTQKKKNHLKNTWSFAWKIENRPTYGDFEKKILDPQLHQIFKPIRKFFCTFLLI